MHVKIFLAAAIFISFILLGSSRIPDRLPARLVNNQSPIVKIRQPEKNILVQWNSLLPYSIDVTDAEDGDSRYDEIASNEVVIKLKLIRDETKLAAYLGQKKFNDTIGLGNMVRSNCFNCHGVKTKLAGPSFQEISQRYLSNLQYREQLINHIRNGSSGVWGREAMPTHPELSESAAAQMVNWILKFANDPGLNFLTGLKGVLPLNKPEKSGAKGTYVMTAFYTDHGTADNGEKRNTGSDHIIIRMK